MEKIITQKMKQAGLRAFFRIAELWNISLEDEMKILSVSPSAYYSWKNTKAAGHMKQDTLMRISYIIRIYRNLLTYFAKNCCADNWIHQPDDVACFAGRTALDLMTSRKIDDLRLVSNFLEAVVNQYQQPILHRCAACIQETHSTAAQNL